MQRVFSALFVAFQLVWTILPTRADGVFAIGIPKGGIDEGVVYGYAIGDDAETRSMRYCRGQAKDNNLIPDNASAAQAACEIAGTFKDECVAFAVNKGSQVGFGWAVAKTSSQAKNRAIAKCQDMAKDGTCYVQQSTCDGSAD